MFDKRADETNKTRCHWCHEPIEESFLNSYQWCRDSKENEFFCSYECFCDDRELHRRMGVDKSAFEGVEISTKCHPIEGKDIIKAANRLGLK